MSSKKTVKQDLIEGLNEVLAHKHGKKILTGRRRELPKPAPEWSAKAIKNFREKILQMSQTEFAALLNVKTPTVRAWEQGHNIPSGAAARLIEALKKDPTLVEKLIA
ncbi:MAG: helix-turn-helix domain-containing protein [Bdellovibrionales bacterium]|nr:helix-turn-helix domain-containing protein [Bdellovibrionales bacterium]